MTRMIRSVPARRESLESVTPAAMEITSFPARSSFIPSNDIDGDCGTTLAFQFTCEEEARRFATAEGIGGVLPIDTGKHVYKRWKPIMEKRGACHPLMDPFKMEANRSIIPDYREDMCPETLLRLAKVVYMRVNPDDDRATLDGKIEIIKKALANMG